MNGEKKEPKPFGYLSWTRVVLQEFLLETRILAQYTVTSHLPVGTFLLAPENASIHKLKSQEMPACNDISKVRTGHQIV